MSVSSRLAAMRPTEIGVGGPTPRDMARDFRSIRRDPLTFLSQVTRRYGDTVAFPVPGPPALLLNDPADVRRVLQTSARNWTKHTVQYGALARVTGQGLLASAEPNWIEHRRLAAPAFHHERLRAVSDQVCAATDATIARELGDPLPAARVVDVAALTHRIGLDAVGRALLLPTDLSHHAHQLLDATAQAADLVVRLGRSVLPAAAWAPTRTTLRLRRTRERLDEITYQVMAERRVAYQRGGEQPKETDLLDMLLASGLPDRQVRDELVTMVIAGHETVAAALTWTLMLLAEHPAAQERLRAEIAATSRPVSMLDQRRASLDARRDRRDVTPLPASLGAVPALCCSRTVGGLEVPAGALAIISPWLLHRRAASWTDPAAFRPERFLDATSPVPGYLPFGQGPRLCIGREFALGEMTVVLSRLLAHHRVSLPGDWIRPAPRALVAVHPRGGMPPTPLTRTSGDRHG